MISTIQFVYFPGKLYNYAILRAPDLFTQGIPFCSYKLHIAIVSDFGHFVVTQHFLFSGLDATPDINSTGTANGTFL